MTLPTGAVLSASEVKRIEDALEALATDHHAPRSLTVTLTLSVRHAYPKVLYKGYGTEKAIKVNSKKEESAARNDGYHDHKVEPAEDAAPEATPAATE